MKNAVDYCYVCMNRYDDFAWRICCMIAEGWQPLGGISVGKGDELVQAMVKYEEDND